MGAGGRPDQVGPDHPGQVGEGDPDDALDRWPPRRGRPPRAARGGRPRPGRCDRRRPPRRRSSYSCSTSSGPSVRAESRKWLRRRSVDPDPGTTSSRRARRWQSAVGGDRARANRPGRRRRTRGERAGGHREPALVGQHAVEGSALGPPGADVGLERGHRPGHLGVGTDEPGPQRDEARDEERTGEVLQQRGDEGARASSSASTSITFTPKPDLRLAPTSRSNGPEPGGPSTAVTVPTGSARTPPAPPRRSSAARHAPSVTASRPLRVTTVTPVRPSGRAESMVQVRRAEDAARAALRTTGWWGPGAGWVGATGSTVARARRSPPPRAPPKPLQV